MMSKHERNMKAANLIRKCRKKLIELSGDSKAKEDPNQLFDIVFQLMNILVLYFDSDAHDITTDAPREFITDDIIRKTENIEY